MALRGQAADSLSPDIARHWLTELSTASYLAIVLCPGLKCASTMADMTQDISSKARLGVKVVLACPRARNIEPSEFILAWSNFVYSHLS